MGVSWFKNTTRTQPRESIKQNSQGSHKVKKQILTLDASELHGLHIYIMFGERTGRSEGRINCNQDLIFERIKSQDRLLK